MSGWARALKVPENFWDATKEIKFKQPHTGKVWNCWEWQKCVGKSGYGQLHVDGATYAHRHAWTLANPGKTIPDGMDMMHDCDNKKCVKPSHLKLGTREQNVNDAVKRGLIGIGDDNPKTKTTFEQRMKICDLYYDGLTQKEIGEMYGINQATVSIIIRQNPRILEEGIKKRRKKIINFRADICDLYFSGGLTQKEISVMPEVKLTCMRVSQIIREDPNYQERMTNRKRL